MIIIMEELDKINSFLEGLLSLESEDEIQKEVQNLYSRECFMFEEKIAACGGTYSFVRSYMILQQPVSMIQSSNKRDFIIDGAYNVSLNLFQLRSKSKTLSEDILVEPFYPGVQIPIIDIYEILKVKPYSRTASRLHSVIHPRNRQRLKERFSTVLPQYFTDGMLNICSVAEFLDMIHHLDTASLNSLFKNNITFTKIQ